MKNSIINLHVHSHFSILDSLSTPEDIVKKTVEQGYPGVAITDHGSMGSYGHFYLEAKKAEIKPIIGIEVYYLPSLEKWRKQTDYVKNDKSLNSKERKEKLKKINKRHHLILLAKNKKGFENLNLLLHKSYENFYYRPRIDLSILNKYHEGLVCSSACIAGELQQAIIQKKHVRELNEIIDSYKNIFKDDYYFEIQINEMKEQKEVNNILLQLSKKHNIKCIITGDSHYTNLEDQKTHQTLLLMNSKSTYDNLKNKKLGDMNSGAWEFDTKRLYLKNYEEYNKDRIELNQEITKKQFDMICENTFDIFDKIENFEINNDVKLKDISPEIKDKSKKLKSDCIKSLKKLNLFDNKEYISRLKYELQTIKEKGLENYFFVVRKIVNYAKKNNILVGAGRGSASGSLVVYLLGITTIDPIRFKLFFERFLARKDYPDIDVDFEDNEKIKDWILSEYKNESACVSSYSTFRLFGLVKDLGKVYGIEDAQYWNKITKNIRKELKVEEKENDLKINEISYDEAIEFSETFRDVCKKHKKLDLDMKILMNKYRHIGKHAGGVIISENLIKNQPIIIMKNQDQTSLTHGMQDNTLEKFGFIKIDVLGLKTLKIIHETAKIISERKGTEEKKILKSIHPNNIDLKYKKAFDMINDGYVSGIFQFDTPGAKQVIEEIIPSTFEDLVAINALNRPGPKQFISLYADRKHGREKIKYDHPLLENILKETNAIMCVEENSLISMKNGKHKKIKDVNIGESVKAVNEKKLTIENNFVVNKLFKKDFGYKLILENGFNVVVTKDHKILTQNGMKELGKLDEKKDLVCLPNNYNHNFGSKIISSWLGKNKEVAYLIGYLIGNGCLTGSAITICTGTKKQHKILLKWICNNFSKLNPKEYFHCRSYYITLKNKELLNDKMYGNRKTKLHKIIEDLGLKKINKKKRIPDVLFGCDSKTQISLIEGIIDSDGTLIKKKSGCYYSICSSSKYLLEDIRHILSLNGISRIGNKENRIYFSNVLRFNPKIKMHNFNQFSEIYEGLYEREKLIGFFKKTHLSERNFEKKYNISSQLFRNKNGFVGYSKVKKIFDLKDVRFYKIKKIESVGEKNFCDLSVESNHNYLANGIFVSNCYQEQIMEISRTLAGFTLEEANVIRKAMGKKIESLMIEQEEKFKKGCKKNNIDEKIYNKIFEGIKKFASYSFNKAHALAYAMIAYQCAFLKSKYPIEFYTALLRVETNDVKIDHTIKEMKSMGIKVKPLDIEISDKNFIINDDIIYYGFCNIKGIGEKAAESIIEARKKKPIKNFKGFLLNEHINRRVCNKGIAEKLLKSFVFGNNFEDKLEFLKWFNDSKLKNKKDSLEKIYKNTKKGFIYLRDANELKIEYLTDAEKVKLEKEMYSANLRLSPFEINGREEKIKKLEKNKKSGTFKSGFEYKTVLFKNIIIRKDKNGNTIAFLDIEDLNGVIKNAIIFSSNFDNKQLKDGVFCVTGSESDKFIIDSYKNIDNLFKKQQ